MINTNAHGQIIFCSENICWNEKEVCLPWYQWPFQDFNPDLIKKDNSQYNIYSEILVKDCVLYSQKLVRKDKKREKYEQQNQTKDNNNQILY